MTKNARKRCKTVKTAKTADFFQATTRRACGAAAAAAAVAAAATAYFETDIFAYSEEPGIGKRDYELGCWDSSVIIF